MAQLAYAADLDVAIEGMSGDAAVDQHVRSYTDPTNATLFGRAAVLGASADLFNVPDGTDGQFIGITIHTHSVEASQVPLATEAIPATQPVNIKSKGRVYVHPEDDIALGDTVFYRHSNAGAAPEGVGKFRSDNDSASGDVTAVLNARWLGAGLANTPVLLEIGLP